MVTPQVSLEQKQHHFFLVRDVFCRKPTDQAADTCSIAGYCLSYVHLLTASLRFTFETDAQVSAVTERFIGRATAAA